MRKFRHDLEIIATIALAIGGATVINSCTSLHEHPLFQNAPGAPSTSKNDLPKLYTEAYIEFAGPADRWAGPPTWILHVKATNPPEISITPPLSPSMVNHAVLAVAPAAALVGENRVPAGVAAVTSIGAPATSTAPAPAAAPTGPTADLVRARLAQLDQWTTPQPGDVTSQFHSCLSPVRVKLVRSDGIITERRGCRIQSAWSTQVSSLASEFATYLSAASTSDVKKTN